MSADDQPVALAVVAHPDDIEFMMAGTMLRLCDAGAEIHFWNLCNGSCGTAEYGRDDIVRIRGQEAKDSAAAAGAIVHEPLVNDLELFFDRETLFRVVAGIRQIRPNIVLTHYPQDYMEDHQNTCRLAVTAAFGRGMRNLPSVPKTPIFTGSTVVYHAMPHGLRDGLNRVVPVDHFVDVTPVMGRKRELLSKHLSQKNWLDVSQGMGAYVGEMENLCRRMGEMSGAFAEAEAFRRHNPLGFAAAGEDPLADLLGDVCLVRHDL